MTISVQLYFNLLSYKPTIHRVVYGGVDDACIDFFAYKNVSSEGTNPIITSFTATAEMITSTEDLVTKIDGQYYINTEDLTLSKVHEISPHDPLTAQLLIEIKSPPLYLLCLKIRKNIARNHVQVTKQIRNYCKRLQPKPDLYMFRNLTEDIARSIEATGELKCFTSIGSRESIFFKMIMGTYTTLTKLRKIILIWLLFNALTFAGSPKIIIALIIIH